MIACSSFAHGEGTAVLGGSFSPPTLEHMGLITKVMERLGLRHGRMVVARPYKAGAAPAAVTTGLTRTAVSHLDEVLETYSMAHSGGHSPANGEYRWVGANGAAQEMAVDDYENTIANPAPPAPVDTLQTLRHLSNELGGPQNVNWISGGDSFSSVPSWTLASGTWQQMFDEANWIVVSRPGSDQGPKDVNFNRTDPLRSVLGEEFIHQ